MGWDAGWGELVGVPPIHGLTASRSTFATWLEAQSHLRYAIEWYWDDGYEATDAQGRERIDGEWLPIHTELHNATENEPFRSNTPTRNLTFWIQHTEGTAP